MKTSLEEWAVLEGRLRQNFPGFPIEYPSAEFLARRFLQGGSITDQELMEPEARERRLETRAQRLAIDFDLPAEKALELLEEWSSWCSQPWPVEALREALEKANSLEVPLGRRGCYVRDPYPRLATVADMVAYLEREHDPKPAGTPAEWLLAFSIRLDPFPKVSVWRGRSRPNIKRP